MITLSLMPYKSSTCHPSDGPAIDLSSVPTSSTAFTLEPVTRLIVGLGSIPNLAMHQNNPWRYVDPSLCPFRIEVHPHSSPEHATLTPAPSLFKFCVFGPGSVNGTQSMPIARVGHHWALEPQTPISTPSPTPTSRLFAPPGPKIGPNGGANGPQWTPEGPNPGSQRPYRLVPIQWVNTATNISA